MSRLRRHTNSIICLCLLAFQAQLFAASLLGCGHFENSDADARITASCHFNSAADQPPADQDRLLDCQKCALHCAVGTQGLLSSMVDLSETPHRAAFDPSLPLHFYHFDPDRFLKPPIALPL